VVLNWAQSAAVAFLGFIDWRTLIWCLAIGACEVPKSNLARTVAHVVGSFSDLLSHYVVVGGAPVSPLVWS